MDDSGKVIFIANIMNRSSNRGALSCGTKRERKGNVGSWNEIDRGAKSP